MRAKLFGVLVILCTLPLAALARGAPQGVAAARAASLGPWTLILQLPAGGSIRVERGSQTLTGTASALVGRVRRGRGGARATRRIVAGTVSVESRQMREIQVAGNMLIITVAPSPNRPVRVAATNRLPMSEDPAHQMLLNLQLVAEGELHARATFAVVDEPGRTAVLFQ